LEKYSNIKPIQDQPNLLLALVQFDSVVDSAFGDVDAVKSPELSYSPLL
jgi:hypothetical protein